MPRRSVDVRVELVLESGEEAVLPTVPALRLRWLRRKLPKVVTSVRKCSGWPAADVNVSLAHLAAAVTTRCASRGDKIGVRLPPTSHHDARVLPPFCHAHTHTRMGGGKGAWTQLKLW